MKTHNLDKKSNIFTPKRIKYIGIVASCITSIALIISSCTKSEQTQKSNSISKTINVNGRNYLTTITRDNNSDTITYTVHNPNYKERENTNNYKLNGNNSTYNDTYEEEPYIGSKNETTIEGIIQSIKRTIQSNEKRISNQPLDKKNRFNDELDSQIKGQIKQLEAEANEKENEIKNRHEIQH